MSFLEQTTYQYRPTGTDRNGTDRALGHGVRLEIFSGTSCTMSGTAEQIRKIGEMCHRTLEALRHTARRVGFTVGAGFNGSLEVLHVLLPCGHTVAHEM